METVTLESAAVIVTAFRRPDYLRRALASWRQARGIGGVHSFTLAAGFADELTFTAQMRVFGEFRQAAGLDGPRGCPRVDSDQARRSNGMHRAIAEAAAHVLADEQVGFVIFGEEDLVVSDDVLEYFCWARRELGSDGRVLAVCAHSRGGAGWDTRQPAGDGDADQGAVRLLPYFSPWVWGTWRDRWEQVIGPSWDHDCNSGGPVDSGYDWNLAARVIPRGGFTCAVPDASRSQNIGRYGGWASDEETWGFSQAASFREHREPGGYRLADGMVREPAVQKYAGGS